MEEDKDQSPLPVTPKQDPATMSDADPKKTNSEIADTIGAEVRGASQRAATFVRETRQSFHFGSYRREDRVEGVKISVLAPSEALDASVPISLAPALPSPMSRPEKKTYSCAECGKEYASRSGLKVLEKCVVLRLVLDSIREMYGYVGLIFVVVFSGNNVRSLVMRAFSSWNLEILLIY